MSEKRIPDLVLATLRMHTAKAEMDLVRVNDELDRTTTVTARSRVLRHLRDQLTAQRDAWEHLAAVSSLGHYPAVHDEVRHPCVNCDHVHHGDWHCGESTKNGICVCGVNVVPK